MKDKSWIEFKNQCVAYLSTLSVNSLRSYAREVGVAKPTTKKKQRLIDEILGVFAGDIAPTPKATQGAPVKESGVDISAVKKEVERIHLQCYSKATGISIEDIQKNLGQSAEQSSETQNAYDFKKELEDFRNREKDTLRLADPDADKHSLYKTMQKEIYRGQFETLGSVQLLLPLNCVDTELKIILPMELVTQYDLREGDIVSCYAAKSNAALVATEILAVNDISQAEGTRIHFEMAEACYPTERIKLFSEKSNSLALKYMDWLLPLGKGQRGFVYSNPKSGKTTLLYDIAQAATVNNRDVDVMVLLIDQPPESVGAFRKLISSEKLISTSYEDEPERQVFAANFLLKRAKRQAECGRDVLLLIDSLNALAYAYNDTNESVGGKMFSNGLESKTLQFIKKYFGTARCLENGGSITIFGTMSTQTGNPADDFICAELSRISNLEVNLSANLAMKRIYPAIDFTASQVKQFAEFCSKEEQIAEQKIRSKFIGEGAAQEILALLQHSDTYEEFVKNI